jgi:hypothetical protein
MALRFARREKSMSRSSRATVLAEISIPSCRNSSAIPAGVLWVHRIPVIGSPAVACSSRISIASITSGVFFPPVCARRQTVGSDRQRHPDPATASGRGP